MLNAILQKIDKFVEDHYDEIDRFVDDYMLASFVWIPWFENRIRNRGKTPGGFGNRPYRSAVEDPKMAEFHASHSDFERMLHLRARTFAPVTRIRSHRLTDKDIKAMSAKGYKIFDGDKGRFVKEIPQALLDRMV